MVSASKASSTSINKALQKEIDDKAQSKLSFGENLSPDEYYGFAMRMKAQLDTLNKNNSRPTKDLCILYRRMAMTCDKQVVPALFKH